MWLFSALVFMFMNAVASESQPRCPANFIGPKCEIPVCNRLNGQLVYRSPDEYFCKCDDGFVGTHCEDAVICQNNGILKGTECDCSKTGFTGRFCNVGSTPEPEPVKKTPRNFIFAITLCFYTLFVVYVFLYALGERMVTATRVDAPYSASHQESKLRNFFYYTFVCKNVKLW